MADTAQLVDTTDGLVDPRLFVDRTVHAAELDRVFARCWLFLCHAATLRQPGEFVTTYMGLDPVIVARQPDGTVAAALNVCRHRGMKVCRADSGNAKAFMCAYHGWTYGLDGALVSVPNFEDGYEGEFDLQRWGLVAVPRVEEYGGLVFGTFDPAAQALGDELIVIDGVDVALGMLADDVEVLGPHKWTCGGNWKLAAEEFAARVAPDDGRVLVFPNFGLDAAEGTLRVWHPVEADSFEVWEWVLVPAGASPADKEARRLAGIRSAGPTTADDARDSANWTGVGHNMVNSRIPRRHALASLAGEQGAFYQRWVDLMNRPQEDSR